MENSIAYKKLVKQINAVGREKLDGYYPNILEEVYDWEREDAEVLIWNTFHEKKEQFVFIKNITREEIQSLKIVRVPVLSLKNEEVSETVLEGKKVIDYLNTFVNEEIIE